jgi:tRNA-binding protein
LISENTGSTVIGEPWVEALSEDGGIGMKSTLKEPLKQQIAYDTFESIDLRVACVVKAPLADGTRKPCRVITLDAGHLGTLTSVGQFALVPEEMLVGRNVVVCVNLAPRKMGPYISQALVLGTPHKDNAPDQGQASPIFAAEEAHPGESIF